MANDSIKFENGQMVRYDANAGKMTNTLTNNLNSMSSNSYNTPTLPTMKLPGSGIISNEDFVNNMTGNINNMYDAQKKAQLSALQLARDKATQEYQYGIDNADRGYAPLRTQAAVAGQKNLNSMKEQMAQQGLFNSGDNITATANINNQTAANINQLNTQKQQYVDDISFKINQLKANGYAEDNNLIQQLEAARMGALIDLGYRADDRNFKTEDLNLRRTALQNQLEQSNFDNSMKLSDFNRQGTWHDQAFDYQKNRDTVGDNQWQQNYNLNDRNSQWENSRWAQEFTEKNKQWQSEFDRQGAWHDQAQALAAARASSGGGGRGGGRSSGRSSGGGGDYSNTDYKNSNQQSLHDYTNNNNYSLAQKLQALSGYANSSGVDSKDAQYANEQKQALLDGRWYEGRYK